MQAIDRGVGPAYVWLHCFLGTPRSLQPLSANLPGMHFFPSARSHSGSVAYKQATIEGMADDLFSFLESHRLQKVNIVGHSMGGKVAMCALGRDPSRFEKAVLMDVAPVDYEKLMPEQAKGMYTGVTDK